jgi:hypothetical protein
MEGTVGSVNNVDGVITELTRLKTEASVVIQCKLLVTAP